MRDNSRPKELASRSVACTLRAWKQQNLCPELSHAPLSTSAVGTGRRCGPTLGLWCGSAALNRLLGAGFASRGTTVLAQNARRVCLLGPTGRRCVVGKAASDRGSALIARYGCVSSGCPGCVRCSTPPAQPRPVGWGAKARARAEATASAVLIAAAQYGRPTPSVTMLTEIVRERARVGAQTAEAAATKALRESAR